MALAVVETDLGVILEVEAGAAVVASETEMVVTEEVTGVDSVVVVEDLLVEALTGKSGCF